MRFTEARAEPRYPFSAGFIEIDDRPLALDDLSVNGLGFHAERPDSFTVGLPIDGFLVLQDSEEQYEMPVHLVVRRIEGTRIGCSMSCKIPHHVSTVREFVSKLGMNGG
ncbi:MAG: PilZ domain-containing protein [Alphaproteobacteria bacterium]|jgi:hypothetical protein|uniref:PilZ domain-containing protein n=1 Tax=Pacificispira sp. TaxID=2888761 RepID=UPI001B072017|nr:PilZ domain-containing protein [Alphaproteobacteria bacterium]MBO6861429.1 PilZ domain-containing protein [Alphaproteobacteria bacterium]MEC9268706.1 PilZ domain-containing protein [Pseudomonadota bacterium]